MITRLRLSILLALLATACSTQPQPRPMGLSPDSPGDQPPATIAIPPLPPATRGPSAVFGAFLDAVRTRDAAEAWELLSTDSQRLLGPEAEEFSSRSFPGLGVRYGPWEGYRIVVDQEVETDVAVVSISGRRAPTGEDVAAAALIREAGVWRLSLLTDPPIRAVSTGPEEAVFQVPGARAARIWVGSRQAELTRVGDTVSTDLPPASAEGPTALTIFSTDRTGRPAAEAFPVQWNKAGP